MVERKVLWSQRAAGLTVELEDSLNVVLVRQLLGDVTQRYAVTDVEALRDALANALVMRDVHEERQQAETIARIKRARTEDGA